MLVKLLVANIFTRMKGNTFNLSKTKINKKKTMKVFVANLQIPCKDPPKKNTKKKSKLLGSSICGNEKKSFEEEVVVGSSSSQRPSRNLKTSLKDMIPSTRLLPASTITSLLTPDTTKPSKYTSHMMMMRATKPEECMQGRRWWYLDSPTALSLSQESLSASTSDISAR